MKSEILLYALNDINNQYIKNAEPKYFKNKNIFKIYKKQYFLVAAIIICILLVACGTIAYFTHNITFPFSNKNQTQFNSVIYDVEPFNLNITLPEQWSLSERQNTDSFNSDIALSGMWSVLDIVNSDNEVVGAVGYNIYEEYEGAENLPQAIYSQIALGNNYHFDVRESYTVIKEMPYGNTATADVYYSANINDGQEKTNKGIVSYNKDLLVYIAIEFQYDKIDEQQLLQVANSIEFIKN